MWINPQPRVSVIRKKIEIERLAGDGIHKVGAVLIGTAVTLDKHL